MGTIVAGKYLLDRVIGHGGMGLVVQATHLQLHQPVAIKLLLPEVSQDASAVLRFVREARAAVRLRSEHVARVLDVDMLEDRTPYMVLEYLEGTDLARFPRARLTVGTLVDLALQACEALSEAHALGIVHRDIKPSNFFITTGPGGAPFLKLLDFGISKTSGATGNLTASQIMLGTPAYMSPEQMRTPRNVDPRSDIWSLGIVLYELIEGVPPFAHEAFPAMVLNVVNDPPPALTAQLPAGLDSVIYRCLEKDRERRFQSTAELVAALAPYAGSPAQAAITVERTRGVDPGRRHGASGADDAPAGPASPAPEPAMAMRAPAARWLRRSLIAAVGALAAAGIVGLASMRGSTAARLRGTTADLSTSSEAPASDTPGSVLAAPSPAAAPASTPVQPTAAQDHSPIAAPDLPPAPPPSPAQPTAAAPELTPAQPTGAPASPPAQPTATPDLPAEATVPVGNAALSVARPADDGDKTAAGRTAAAGGKPRDASPRPHRSRPATSRGLTHSPAHPSRPEMRHDSPSTPPPSPRFDRGD